MKNKKISMYIVGVMLIALCFAGCGKKNSDSTKISETSETEESTTGVEETESEPEEKVQTAISSRWNIDFDAVKGKAYHMMFEKNACWEGRYHTSCEDDGKALSGEDVLSSVAKGRHSFIYMYMRGDAETADGVIYGPTLIGEDALSMNELFYMLDLAAGYNEGFDITGFMLIDLDGDGVREMVVRGEYKSMYAYYVFYTIGSNAYLTSFDSRSVSHINEDGSIINSNNEPMFLNFSNVEPFFDYKAWKLENDFETVYFVEGHETTKEEYDSYITKWNSERTECTYTDFREDTLGKAYEHTEPETKSQASDSLSFTGLLERWPVGSTNDEYDSYYWYYEGEENDYKLWDGTKHSVCEDDNKKIIGEELLQSVMEGKHSFKYMQNGTGMNAYNEFAITDGAMLNMDEFFYMLRYAYTGTKDNLQCDVHDFMVLDLDGDGVRELIMSGNSSAIGFNVVFYTSGNEAYMTAFNMVNGGSITADSLIEGGYCDTYRVKRDGDKMNLVVNSYYRYGGDSETIILDGKDCTYDEYKKFIDDWKIRREEPSNFCTWTECNYENLQRAYK